MGRAKKVTLKVVKVEDVLFRKTLDSVLMHTGK